MKNFLKFLLIVPFVLILSCSKDDDEPNNEKSDELIAPDDIPTDATFISVSTLEQLYAIRYDLDGDGEADSSGDEEEYKEAFPDIEGEGFDGYKLTEDLDFSDESSYAAGEAEEGWSKSEDDEGWDPIGTSDDPYEAFFDGAGHVISNLYIDREDINDVGLFGAINEDARIYNLGLRSVEINAAQAVGALIGNVEESAQILSCYVEKGKIKGAVFIGGLVGRNLGFIRNSYSTADVTTNIEGPILSNDIYVNYIGGLVGFNSNGEITACYATGDVEGFAQVGGLVGANGTEGEAAYITACYATGKVEATSGTVLTEGGTLTSPAGPVGGLVGTNGVYGYGRGTAGGQATITFPPSTDNAESVISASYATGRVAGEGADTFGLGGLVGTNSGHIKACYSTSAVTKGSMVGGLVGMNFATIEASYAVGKVNGNRGEGGLYGEPLSELSDLFGDEEVTDSYFDSEETGQDEGKEAKDTDELQEPTDYEDIYEDWNIDIDSEITKGDSDEDDPWDFGGESDYPKLQVDFNGDGSATADEFGDQE